LLLSISMTAMLWYRSWDTTYIYVYAHAHKWVHMMIHTPNNWGQQGQSEDIPGVPICFLLQCTRLACLSMFNSKTKMSPFITSYTQHPFVCVSHCLLTSDTYCRVKATILGPTHYPSSQWLFPGAWCWSMLIVGGV